MNKRLIIIGIIILALSIGLRLLWGMLKNVKLDEFKPAMVVFVVDSSASNQQSLPEQKKFLKQICSSLDPEDKIKIIKVSQEAYLIYEGTPHNNSGITKAADAFTQYDEKEYGTAYGEALKKAFSYVLTAEKDGYTPAVVVLGDLESEGDITKQADWANMDKNVENVKKYAPEMAMMFLFAHPKKLDMVKEKLNPVLGEKKLILSPEQNADKALRSFINALGR